MAPTKSVPTKVPKALSKPIEKPISKTKKKKNFHNFSLYLFKILKLVTQKKDIGISRKSILIMNDFVYDLMEKLAAEGGRLVAHSKKNTFSSREIQSAVKFLVPGELAKVANVEGLKAVTKYHNSQEK